ncbi:glycosyltransferase family 2 protein [Gordonia sp. AC31]|uniref:glycosyltransferase family 2 protein n=1 Tax=Gordonia sp. AC31 TaxID=2962571 RepID=UPI0028821F9E|nr:glycosyltransferase family 2 protein [Gordonia sp. AC31]MDT0223427.1 glycosyltransferase family 2 protein [Gordonia sp. AC31]
MTTELRGPSSASVSLIVLTKNEEIHIGRLLSSPAIKRLCKRVIIVDSFSTDRTRTIATSLGAECYEHEFTSQASQLSWALDTIEISTDWIIRLDADELIGEDLVDNVLLAISSVDESVCGFEFNRRHVHDGRWVRFGGRYPLWLFRMWRTGKAMPDGRLMDEHMVLKEGVLDRIDGLFEDRNVKSTSEFILKHDSYATREALAVLSEDYFGQDWQASGSQARIKRLIKAGVYQRMPYPLAAFVYFVSRYIFGLGFLDGRAGLDYHVLQGFWYRYLVGVRIKEFRAILERVGSFPDVTNSRDFEAELLAAYKSGELAFQEAQVEHSE